VGDVLLHSFIIVVIILVTQLAKDEKLQLDNLLCNKQVLRLSPYTSFIVFVIFNLFLMVLLLNS
jgi:putative exporter of polyketide antibiotics